MAGARRFLVGNIPAQGCSPSVLSDYSGRPEDYDQFGCLIPVNNLVRSYNSMLHDVVEELRRKFPGAKFIYADNHQANLDIIRDAEKYGEGLGLLAQTDRGFRC